MHRKTCDVYAAGDLSSPPPPPPAKEASTGQGLHHELAGIALTVQHRRKLRLQSRQRSMSAVLLWCRSGFGRRCGVDALGGAGPVRSLGVLLPAAGRLSGGRRQGH